MIELAPEAVDEIAEAATWYEEQRAGLSAEFLLEVDRSLAQIAERPATFARLRDVPEDLVIRRALLDRFPFGLVFLELPGDKLRVLAVAHTKRRPGYWLRRVKS
ncbi:MAG: hypothetical protein QM820_48985 [Minicystis sp.]